MFQLCVKYKMRCVPRDEGLGCEFESHLGPKLGGLEI